MNKDPSLSNGVYFRLPPAGGGGWDNFLLTQSVKQGHNLSASCRPDVHYDGNLVEETRGGRRATRVVRVLRVDTNMLYYGLSDHQGLVLWQATSSVCRSQKLRYD